MTGARFIGNMGFGCVIPVLPLFAAEMGLGASGVGLILSCAAVSRVLLNVPAGRLADRLGRKPLMIGGQLTSALASFGTGLSTSLAPLLACRLLLGAGTSLSMAGFQAYIADMTAKVPQHRAKITGVQTSVINLAYAAGPALGGALCDVYGARPAFFIVGAATATAAAGYSMLPETFAGTAAAAARAREAREAAEQKEKEDAALLPPPDDGAKANAAAAAAAAAKEDKGEEQQPGATQLSMRDLWRLVARSGDHQGVVATNFAVCCSYSALMAVLPLHADALLGATPGDIGLLFAGGTMVGFFAGPVGGWLADKVGRKAVVVPAGCVAAAGVAATVGLDALMPGGATFWGLTAAVALWGFGNALTWPGLSAFTADISGKKETRAQVMTLARQAGDLAFLVAPVGLGLLAELSGSTGLALGTAGAVMLAATGVFAARTTETLQRVKRTGGGAG